MNKIIVLDIDGVLINSRSIQKYNDGNKMDQECVEELVRIIKETDCNIVISSTWRLSEIMEKDFINAGMPKIVIDKIIGVTPSLDRYDETTGLFAAHERKDEIKVWLEKNPVDKYVVIDDERDADLGDGSFVKTNFYMNGLTKEIADLVIEKLKGN